MPFVLDASIAANWYVDEQRHPSADRALDLLEDDEALAPPLWWFEVCNVILAAERRKDVSSEYSAGVIAQLHDLSITIDLVPRYDDALALARRHRLTFYDAAYLELAMRQRLPLATLDNNLMRAARAEGIALIG